MKTECCKLSKCPIAVANSDFIVIIEKTVRKTFSVLINFSALTTDWTNLHLHLDSSTNYPHSGTHTH